ncbi:MAG: alpha/beta hydrolase [Rhodospirillaceae bacterium]|jgi:3-oxoadipate enol-lactonase|nr:alpha/beta hydrolase [Rhodospirillaceae bacterium]MBT7956190.1 alpha/beta hydrolase [Rhodospirillaceae bacterium]
MTTQEMTQHWVDGKPIIGFDEIGAGPPAIFLHGIGGNRTSWTSQQLAVADMCTAISWDARGYGKSDDYDGPLNFSDFGDDLERLLDARGIEQAHFIGLSMGARILMDFFPRYAERVATLTLCDCFFSYATALSPQKQQEFVDLRQKPLREGKSPADLAPTLIDSLVGPNCSEQARDQLYQSLVDIHVESYLKTIAATITYDASGSLADFNVPVQLIFGEHDKLTPPSIGEAMLEKIPQAQMAVIEDAGHLSNLEQPEAFNEILRDFLAEHLTSARYK